MEDCKMTNYIIEKKDGKREVWNLNMLKQHLINIGKPLRSSVTSIQIINYIQGKAGFKVYRKTDGRQYPMMFPFESK